MDGKPTFHANNVWENIRHAVSKDSLFPIDVKTVALDIYGSIFPDPITDVKPCALPGFEGLLVRNSVGSKWMIAYNDQLESPGRIRFTLAHEFGHYLMHRSGRDEFKCSQNPASSTDALERKIEAEADSFSSALLMPAEDFRQQIDSQRFSIAMLMHCANRYGVSLTAAALKWRDMARGRVIVVAAKDGFLDWASSNSAAFRSGAYFATKKETIEVPPGSLLQNSLWTPDGNVGALPAKAWFPNEPDDMILEEHAFVVEGKGFCYTLGILLLPDLDEPHLISNEKVNVPLSTSNDKTESR